MYLLYVDESGDPGPSGSPYLLLGGAAIFEGKWRHVDGDIRRLIAQYFPSSPRPNEIHFAPLFQGKGVYQSLSRADRLNLIREFCRLVDSLLSTEIALFTVIADKAWWFHNNPGKGGDDLYAELFEQLSSRFDFFLRRRHAEGSPAKGIVIADEHKPALSAALKHNYKAYQLNGNRWGSTYNLIETVFFLPSDESPGLQIADLCAYATWRLVNSGDNFIINQISATFYREPLTSRVNAGKWHGVHFIGNDIHIRNRINLVWQ